MGSKGTALGRGTPSSRRLLALALLGYVYLTTVMATLCAVLVAVVVFVRPGVLAIKLALPVVVLVVLVVRSVRVTLTSVRGIEVDAARAPRLFELIEAVRLELDAPRVDHVLVDDAFNASVATRVRLDPPGWTTSLVLGLPFMESQTPEELRSVVAHELAHLSRRHGRWRPTAYRARETWCQLLDALERRRQFGSFLFRPFFAWYVPLLDRQWVRVSRAHELEADAISAEVGGLEHVASQLVRTRVAARLAETRYWPSVFARAADEPEPPDGAISGLGAALRDVSEDPDLDLWIEDALAQTTADFDTHPSLSERLAALDFPDTDPLEIPYPAPSAAMVYLGEQENELALELDHAWRDDVRAHWNGRFVEAAHARAELADLTAREATLTEDELKALAALTERFHGTEAAKPLYERLVAAHPDDPHVNFALGKILVAENELAGIEYLDKAAALSPQWAVAASEAALPLLRRAGLAERIATFEARAASRHQLVAKARHERASAVRNAELEPHRLPVELVERAREVLSGHEELLRVYVARRRFEYLPDEAPAFVVGLLRCDLWSRKDRIVATQRLVRSVLDDLQLPGDVSIFFLEREGRLYRKLKRLPGALVFERGRTWHAHRRRLVIRGGTASLLLALAFGAPLASSASHLHASAPCTQGRAYAGVESMDNARMFDGVRATVTPIYSSSGLNADEQISGLVGIGDSQRGYLAATIDASHLSGPDFGFGYELARRGALVRTVPLSSSLIAGAGYPHVLEVRRVWPEGWVVRIDGKQVGRRVDLPGSSQGLAHPRIYLVSDETDSPCNNAGSFRFSRIAVLPHAAAVWTGLPDGTRELDWPGYKLDVHDPSDFTASSKNL